MVYLYVGIGGMIGSVLRYILSLVTLPYLGNFPIGTLTVNLIGSFALAVLTGITLCKQTLIDPQLKTGITTGLIGSFTTFSTLCLEVYHLFQEGLYISLSIYFFLTVAGGLGFTILGLQLGNKSNQGSQL